MKKVKGVFLYSKKVISNLLKFIELHYLSLLLLFLLPRIRYESPPT